MTTPSTPMGSRADKQTVYAEGRRAWREKMIAAGVLKSGKNVMGRASVDRRAVLTLAETTAETTI